MMRWGRSKAPLMAEPTALGGMVSSDVARAVDPPSSGAPDAENAVPIVSAGLPGKCRSIIPEMGVRAVHWADDATGASWYVPVSTKTWTLLPGLATELAAGIVLTTFP